MKRNIVVLLLLLLLAACTKNGGTPAEQILGNTYRGFQFESVLDGQPIYHFYVFSSPDRAEQYRQIDGVRVDDSAVAYTVEGSTINISGKSGEIDNDGKIIRLNDIPRSNGEYVKQPK